MGSGAFGNVGISGGGIVTDASIVFSDITTGNVSVVKHGFAPKAPNDATKFLNGVGVYSVPSGGASGGAITGTLASQIDLNTRFTQTDYQSVLNSLTLGG